MNLTGGVNPWVIGGFIAFLFISAGAVWLVCAVGEAMRGRGTQPPGCPWCRPLGLFSDISHLPRDCECDEACGAPWCQHYPATR